MSLAILLLLTAAMPEIPKHYEGGTSSSVANSTGALTITGLAPLDREVVGVELAFGGFLAFDQDTPPPPKHPELSTKTRAGFDTVQLRKKYQDCVRRAAREGLARSPSATLSSLLPSLCGNESAALRAAILRREKASSAASQRADEEVADATNAALETIRR